MKQCFGYVRVSTAKQGEGVSLEAQKEAIQAFADRQGLVISRWHEEKETAAKSGRPVFNTMVRDLRRGKAQGLIVHKIDRSARNFADWAKIGDLADAGIDIHFATESLDFRSRGGRLAADVQAVVAADYIRNLREETIKGISGRLKQGLYPFKAPIGYLDNGGGKPKTPDPVRAPFIRQAYDLYASGQFSIRALVMELERRGLRSESGKPVTKCGVETMLANPFYCGIIRIKRTGQTYPGVHEPLIPVSLFEEVQARKSGRAIKKVTRHHFTYRGLFRCAHCQRAMIPERQKGHAYYRCHTRRCPTLTVREELIEDAIYRTLSDARLSEIDVDRLCQEFDAWLAKRNDAARALTLTDQINKVGERIDRLTDALIDRLIDQQTFADRNEELVLEKAHLEEQKRQAETSRPDPAHVRKFLELMKTLAATYLIVKPAEKRDIAEFATSNRTVSVKSPYLEPSELLKDVSLAVAGLTGAPARTTSRTEGDRSIELFNKLLGQINGKNVAYLLKGDTPQRPRRI